MKKILLPALCVLLFSQCKKVDETEISTLNARTANGFNYDQFGISHNNYLDYVKNNTASNSSDETRFNKGKNYVDSYFGSFNSGPNWTSFYPQTVEMQQLTEDVLTGKFNATTFTNSKHLSPNMTTFLTKLSQIYFNTAENELLPATFDAEIQTLEDWVIQNQNPQFDTKSKKGNEGAGMLAMCSIAKSSYTYWYNDPTTQNLQGRNIFGKIWRAIKIGAADAYGFVFDGWIDTDNNGTNETWSSVAAVKAAGEHSDAAGR